MAGNNTGSGQQSETSGPGGGYIVFPNPGDGKITFKQAVALDRTVKVKVYNYAGAGVYYDNLEFRGGTSQMDLVRLASGVYMVVLTDDKGETTTFRVVKQ